MCESVRVVLTCATKPGPSTVAPLSSGPQLQDQENACIGSTVYPHPSTPPLLTPSLLIPPSSLLHSPPSPLLIPHSHPLYSSPPPLLTSHSSPPPLLTPPSLTCSYRSNLCVPCVGKIFPPRYLSPCHLACVYQTPAPCKPRPLHRHH